MVLTILLIVVICLALGGALAVWIVQDAIARQQPAASGGGPAVMELRDAGEAPAAAPGPAQATIPPATGGVVFEAVGANGATRAVNITHTVGWDIRQDAGVALPWRREVQPGSDGRLSLWVQNAGTQGAITCRIIVNGQVAREETTSVPYGVCRVAAARP